MCELPSTHIRASRSDTVSFSMHHAVLLKHTLPDGSWHYDWLIEQPACTHEHRLLALKTQIRPDLLAKAPFETLKLQDHRVQYLNYEGPISKGRGTVQRIAAGIVESFLLTPDSIKTLIRWDDQTISYQGFAAEPLSDRWIFNQSIMDSRLDADTTL